MLYQENIPSVVAMGMEWKDAVDFPRQLELELDYNAVEYRKYTYMGTYRMDRCFEKAGHRDSLHQELLQYSVQLLTRTRVGTM